MDDGAAIERRDACSMNEIARAARNIHFHFVDRTRREGNVAGYVQRTNGTAGSDSGVRCKDRRAHSACALQTRTRDDVHRAAERSEEPTSELQSLMRISSAVFCLKKKKKEYNNKETKIKTS